jgi:Rrf2 family protein
MKLQKNSTLALYSVLEFAAAAGRIVSAAEIVEKYGVSAHHLAKVLSELARAGMVESVRGVGGGYRFSGNPRRITLMDVIRMFEDVSSPAARTERGDATPAGRALGLVMTEIDDISRATLNSITIATMLKLIDREALRPRRPRRRAAA